MQSAEELYRIYSADLYRYLLFLTHSADHAEDLMMETFLRAITGANRQAANVVFTISIVD